jgi:hypothetical protein
MNFGIPDLLYPIYETIYEKQEKGLSKIAHFIF